MDAVSEAEEIVRNAQGLPRGVNELENALLETLRKLVGERQFVEEHERDSYELMLNLRVSVDAMSEFLNTTLGRVWLLEMGAKQDFSGYSCQQALESIKHVRKALNTMASTLRENALQVQHKSVTRKSEKSSEEGT